VRASNSGSLAIFAAIRRASSRVSQLGLRIVCPAHPRNKGKPISAWRARLLCRERQRDAVRHYKNFTKVNGFCWPTSGRIQCRKSIIETGKN
jgi:hypothetical protein